MIKVSVILPVYNTEKYLRQCLESIEHQTLKEMEVFCVDDGSSDGSVEIIREYVEKDSRFHLLEAEKCRRRCCQKSWNERGKRRISDVPGCR